jgi:hypothetical protein
MEGLDPSQMEGEATDTLRARVLGAPATLDNDNVLPPHFRKEENGNMSVGYSGWIALTLCAPVASYEALGF